MFQRMDYGVGQDLFLCLQLNSQPFGLGCSLWPHLGVEKASTLGFFGVGATHIM